MTLNKTKTNIKKLKPKGAFIIWLFLVFSCSKKEAEFKFQNQSLSTKERAVGLISQYVLYRN